ncbi:hypothetical protein V8D89_007677 [Ganoderma adspersum]
MPPSKMQTLRSGNWLLQSERRLLIDKNSELEARLDLRLFKEREIEPFLQAQQHHSPLDLVNLPQEIVLRICLAAIPSRHQYDSFILAGPRTPWLESLNTRKSLTLVCRTWNGPASEALYTNIVFRRMGQISALARTFRASAVVNAPRRVRFVKRIYMNCCTIMPSCEKVIEEDLEYLLRHCTELESFIFRSHPLMENVEKYGAPWLHPSAMFNPPWMLDADDACVHALEERCATGLQELVFATDLTPDESLDVLRIVQVGVNLTSLTLGAISLPMRGWNFTVMGAQPADLPRLEELQIHLTNHFTDSLSDFISESWTLPRLERLTLVGCNYLPECILTAHGLRLRYLHFVPDRREPWAGEPAYTPLEVVGQCCLMLEHLVMPFLPALDPLCTLNSPTLRYLDLWGPPHKRRIVELWGEMGRASLLPELVGVRLLPAAHVAQLPVDLPHICHPEDVGADEVLVRTFPCVRVLQTSWALLADVGHDRGVSFVDEELDEDDSDAEGSWFGSEVLVEGEEEVAAEGEGGEEAEGDVQDYDDGTSWVSESDADDGTSSLSSVDGHREDADDAEEIERLEFDRDTVLDRFTASQLVDFLFDDDSSTDDGD